MPERDFPNKVLKVFSYISWVYLLILFPYFFYFNWAHSTQGRTATLGMELQEKQKILKT